VEASKERKAAKTLIHNNLDAIRERRIPLLHPVNSAIASRQTRPLTKHGKRGIYTHSLSFSSLIKDVMVDHIAQHRSQKIHLQNQAALRVEHLANLFSQSPILSVFWPLSGGNNSSMLYTSFDGNKFRLSVEDDLPSGKAPTLPPPSLLHTLVRAALGPFHESDSSHTNTVTFHSRRLYLQNFHSVVLVHRNC